MTDIPESLAPSKRNPKRKNPKRHPAKKDREGLIAVVDIAKEYKLAPRDARALLRAAKLKKPVGWAFAPNSPELKRVREMLKAGKGD
jgi:hypothetical protein